MVQLLYIIASLHVLMCPFTKVEESFNIQAIHDILYNRHNLTQYDHNEFPGVVPRSFLGPIVISTLCAPVVGFLHLLGINKFWTQYVVRLSLTLTVIVAWTRLRNTLQKQFGNTFSWWFTLITISQYHFMFYMSRPLPNIMVMPLVLLAFDGWLSGNYKQFIISAGASIVIFRAELAILFGLFLIIDLHFKKIEIKELLKIVIPAGIGLVALTVTVDSIFWGRFLWPEAEVFWYNTIMNKSSEWGTSPFLWYLYSALPRGLGPSLVLVPLGLYLDRRLVPLVAPALAYILLYSFLPHKELRFIIYVFPLLNAASAVACSYIFVRRSKAPVYELLFSAVAVVVAANVAMTVALTIIANNNYPGGVAITRFHKLLKDEPYVHVHISNLAAQTGVTRFTQIHDHWIYNKTENLDDEQLMDFTHLIIEAKSKYSPAIKAFSRSHTILDNVDSFHQIAVNYKLWPPLKIKTKPALFILEKNDFRTGLYEINLDDIVIGKVEFAPDTPEDEISLEDFANEVYKKEQEETGSQQFIDEPDNDFQQDEKIQLEPPTPTPVLVVADEDDENIQIEHQNEEMPKAKKALDEFKILRKEKKKKAIEKIKSETRKEVVASAKEKLKEIMKRHKHIAEELSENIIEKEENKDEIDGRGDIPEQDPSLFDKVEDYDHETVHEPVKESIEINQQKEINDNTEKRSEHIIDPINRTNENIEAIVEEVIARLIDRKIYDDKTKPEDLKGEDRQMIQKIVEEVLSEKMNYTLGDK